MLKFIGINSNTISVNKSGPKQYNIIKVGWCDIAPDHINPRDCCRLYRKKKKKKKPMENGPRCYKATK